MKMTYLIMALVYVGCCTGELAILKHPYTGDVQKCEVSGSDEFLTGFLIPYMHHRDCIKQWEAQGYVKTR